MPRGKTKVAPKSDREGYATLQVPVAIKKVLKDEQANVFAKRPTSSKACTRLWPKPLPIISRIDRNI